MNKPKKKFNKSFKVSFFWTIFAYQDKQVQKVLSKFCLKTEVKNVCWMVKCKFFCITCMHYKEFLK